ncbi:MAG: hypothetical protein HZY76_07685 [Anaerolineae bacterium]|nr:MAG: hypothetical protein HZY76_07685 [Anaerolineae bacterium]
MEITLHTGQVTFDMSDVRATLAAALSREATLARTRRNAYERACQAFEARFQITSEQFLADSEAGKLGDDLAYFDWYAAKRGFDLWQRRSEILSQVVV